MRERPILFSGAMVRALLDVRKTQTRRVVKNQPPCDVSPITVSRYHPTIIDRHREESPGEEIFGAYSDDGEWGCKCPFGEPGDRLWVRETTYNVERNGYVGPVYVESENGEHAAAWGWGESDDPDFIEPYELRKRPAIHMPRSMSRITLEVTGVRVERLQDTSEQDAIAEGIEKTPAGFWSTYGRRGVDGTYSPHSSFHCLWESINGPESWEANPWVWVVEFKKVPAAELGWTLPLLDPRMTQLASGPAGSV